MVVISKLDDIVEIILVYWRSINPVADVIVAHNTFYQVRFGDINMTVEDKV